MRKLDCDTVVMAAIVACHKTATQPLLLAVCLAAVEKARQEYSKEVEDSGSTEMAEKAVFEPPADGGTGDRGSRQRERSASVAYGSPACHQRPKVTLHTKKKYGGY